jgi:hypothetical protein
VTRAQLLRVPRARTYSKKSSASVGCSSKVKERERERDEPFTGDVFSTDGNGGTEAAAMVNGVARVARHVKV